MTLFEYLAIAYTLLISFAVSRVLTGLSAALSSERRYWIHLAYVVWILGSSLMVFWSFWFYRDVDWSLPRFMLRLMNPALLLILATQIMPANVSESISWRDHFFGIRRALCATASIWLCTTSFTSYFLREIPLTHPSRLFMGLSLVSFLAGVISSKPIVHGAIVVFNLATMAVAMAFIFASPSGAGPIAP